MLNKFKIFCIAGAMFTVSGCAVYKATSNEGIAVWDIKHCTTRECFLSHGMDVLETHEDKAGKYIVVYRSLARKSGVNYFRAAGHGVLDVATLGLWEVVGTPIEGALSNNRGYITAKAIYACKAQEKIEHLQIYNANGQLVVDKLLAE